MRKIIFILLIGISACKQRTYKLLVKYVNCTSDTIICNCDNVPYLTNEDGVGDIRCNIGFSSKVMANYVQSFQLIK